ncbi:MAG TPA: hypothetical protein VF676_04650 [Flavobacterium sp.]|jgi:hypothetical protein
MRKNRNKSVTLLLIVVLAIWGVLFYKFFSFSDKERQISNNPVTAVKPLAIKPRDSFNVDINPRDPFLGHLLHKEVPRTSTNPTKRKPQVPLVWPSIRYKGTVSDNREKVKVYMLEVDGKTFLLKKGEVESGITILGGTRESVDVAYKSAVKKFLIQ